MMVCVAGDAVRCVAPLASPDSAKSVAAADLHLDHNTARVSFLPPLPETSPPPPGSSSPPVSPVTLAKFESLEILDEANDTPANIASYQGHRKNSQNKRKSANRTSTNLDDVEASCFPDAVCRSASANFCLTNSAPSNYTNNSVLATNQNTNFGASVNDESNDVCTVAPSNSNPHSRPRSDSDHQNIFQLELGEEECNQSKPLEDTSAAAAGIKPLGENKENLVPEGTALHYPIKPVIETLL